eukprot:CAMPEP_0170941266 /NCGR_PEP_ID=MMETSP0735-20130129/23315_1 /TAXON_ID=186038 /ORGANISM="Fragilariopsis kerguelensis, Strain L26-C5" /LENGTH=33 /DNA_ID= /DNA_START= /DNA_END= /DNA_ORIENTATION=
MESKTHTGEEPTVLVAQNYELEYVEWSGVEWSG